MMNSTLPMAPPKSTSAETLARQTFQTMMWALSNPGRIFTLPGSSFSTYESCRQIGLTVLDLEVSFYTTDPLLQQELKQGGAQCLTAANADYLFFPESDVFNHFHQRQTLSLIERAQSGTLLDPEQSATLIIGCLLGEGRKLRLKGPGIQQSTDLIVDELPIEFWQLRNEKINYPLGVDLFLVDADQLVGLPRTTIVEFK